MKKYIVLTLSIMLIAFSGSAFAMHGSTSEGDAAGGIIDSRHNLSSYGNHLQAHSTGVNATTAIKTTQICVFCHTPHFTETFSGATTGPLWNKKVRPGVYTAYTSVFDPTEIGNLGGGSAGAQSLACLSCHDGTMAIDTMVNAPGKDGVDLTGEGQPQGWYFYEGMPKEYRGNLVPARVNLGETGGINLSNDHPISMDYPTGFTTDVTFFSLRPKTTTFSSIAPLDNAQMTGGNAVSDNLWSVNGVISGTQAIENVLRAGKVECSTCHDPHYKNQTNPDPGFVATYADSGNHMDKKIDGLFLRRVGGNSNSGVCRTCHAK